MNINFDTYEQEIEKNIFKINPQMTDTHAGHKAGTGAM